MTDQQLHLAIGAPMLFNALLAGLIVAYINARLRGVDAEFSALNRRLDDLRDLWRAELRRVEEVLEARLKHLEERA